MMHEKPAALCGGDPADGGGSACFPQKGETDRFRSVSFGYFFVSLRNGTSAPVCAAAIKSSDSSSFCHWYSVDSPA